MARRTRDQICDAKRKERRHWYYERTKARKVLDNDALKNSNKAKDKAKYKRAQKAIERANNKVAKINTYLFKCGKRYAKLKTDRRRAQNRISKINKQLQDKSISDFDREKLLLKSRKLQEYQRGIGRAMDQQFDVIDGKVRIKTSAEKGVFAQDDVFIWDIPDRVMLLIASGRFDKVILGTEVLDAKEDEIMLRLKLDEYKEYLIEQQEITKRYRSKIVADEGNREVEVIY